MFTTLKNPSNNKLILFAFKCIYVNDSSLIYVEAKIVLKSLSSVKIENCHNSFRYFNWESLLKVVEIWYHTEFQGVISRQNPKNIHLHCSLPAKSRNWPSKPIFFDWIQMEKVQMGTVCNPKRVTGSETCLRYPWRISLIQAKNNNVKKSFPSTFSAHCHLPSGHHACFYEELLRN